MYVQIKRKKDRDKHGPLAHIYLALTSLKVY